MPGSQLRETVSPCFSRQARQSHYTTSTCQVPPCPPCPTSTPAYSPKGSKYHEDKCMGPRQIPETHGSISSVASPLDPKAVQEGKHICLCLDFRKPRGQQWGHRRCPAKVYCVEMKCIFQACADSSWNACLPKAAQVPNWESSTRP